MRKPNPHTVIHGLNLAFVGLWLMVLFSSLAFKASSKFTGWPNWDDFVIGENRERAGKPDLRRTPTRAWGEAVEAWYNDNFAWRSRLIQFYRHVHFHWLKTAVGDEVPGLDGWIFRRGGNWAELDDYLGGFELTDAEMEDWIDLFEGRRQWAEAHGTRYLQLVTSVKAQIHNEKVFPAIRKNRGVCVREQLQRRLATSSAAETVVFTHETLLTAARTQPVFYEEDHHVNARGVHLVYATLARTLSAWFGGPFELPFYDTPPPAVLAGEAPGTFERDRRLEVVVPGARQVDDPLLALSVTGVPFPMASVAVEQGGGGGLHLVLANDSFLRFPLRSWDRARAGTMRFPFTDAVGRVVSLLFLRYDTRGLDAVVSERVPDVIIEQFTESRLSLGTLGLDDVMRRAAAFGRGVPLPGAPPAGTWVLACAELDGVTDADGTIAFVRFGEAPVAVGVELVAEDDRVLAASTVEPGVRRAVFFEPVEAPGGPLRVRVRDGLCASALLRLRTGRESGTTDAHGSP